MPDATVANVSLWILSVIPMWKCLLYKVTLISKKSSYWVTIFRCLRRFQKYHAYLTYPGLAVHHQVCPEVSSDLNVGQRESLTHIKWSNNCLQKEFTEVTVSDESDLLQFTMAPTMALFSLGFHLKLFFGLGSLYFVTHWLPWKNLTCKHFTGQFTLKNLQKIRG